MARTTVLKKYQRLEAEGVWRSAPDTQRRDVIISIGEATLILSDLNENVLTHWSLPAINRLNPGLEPALYSPGSDAPDTLEIHDKVMIDALARVSKAIRKGQPHPGRLRFGIFTVIIAAVVCGLLFWLPGAVSRYAASILPEAAREVIARDVLDELERVAGAPCSTPAGQRALVRLEQRLFPEAERTILIFPSALTGTRHLPGGFLLVDHRLVEDEETPGKLADALLVEDARLTASDATEALLGTVGVRATLRLLATGHLPDSALGDYANRLITAPSEDAGTAPTVLSLDPVLSDSNWIALQQICEG